LITNDSIFARLAARAHDFHAEIRERPVTPAGGLVEIRAHLEGEYRFDERRNLEEVVDDVWRMLRDWNLHVTHPRYFGLFNPSVREAGVLADLLVAVLNPQLAAWSHAPAANEMERHTLRRLADVVGLPGETVGSFASGGAEANLSAVLAALAHHFPDTWDDGLAALGARPALYVTSESHHSFLKIARMTGLGTAAVREVPVRDDLAMDPRALRQRIEADRREGWYPLAIVGTAGTTGAGVIDPLAALADVAAASGAWFHVDGAWGAAAALSPSLRPLLAGIERADSLTWDAHKWLSVPMGAGMFFCRHPAAVRRAFAVATSYMPGAAAGDVGDPYATTAQWSRRFIGLKVFMALAELGLGGYRQLVEHQSAMGEVLRALLRERGWEVVNKSRLPVVCFTHPDIVEGTMQTGDVLRVIYDRGRVWISDVVLGSRPRALRACITSFRTETADVEFLVDEMEAARSVVRQRG
jgi:aromatic-L-amino-acid/L-tryptophan decarboxylase